MNFEAQSGADAALENELRRVEVKYVIDRARRTPLLRDLKVFMCPDTHAGTDGSYLVRSLYFDSPFYAAYHEKMAGCAVRHKLRTRVYGDEPAQAPFVRLEVKSRYMQFIHKLSADVSHEEYRELEQALRNRTLPSTRLVNRNRASREFFRLQRQYNMEPKLLIQYRRLAFERTEFSRARVNFDDEIWILRGSDLFGSLRGARRLLPYAHAVLEIKVDGLLPYWLHFLIAKYELQDQAISKFCFAVQNDAKSSAVARVEDELALGGD